MARNGLASRIRAEAAARRGDFTPASVSVALGIPPGPAREVVSNVFGDFVKRGEMVRVGRGLYRYVHSWRPAARIEDVDLRRIHKAIYVCGEWTVSDIRRLAGTGGSHTQKVVRRLVEAGLVRQVARRAALRTVEPVYQVADRNRFRKEMLP